VGEMNNKLLEKVEELTLYLIELKKENEALKARVEKLEKK
jgi:cell division protein FtsB